MILRKIANCVTRVLFCVILFAAARCEAHDVWADGTAVPAWVKSACCGPQDVHVIDSEDVDGPNKQGFYKVKDVDELVSGDRVYDSLDGVAYVFYDPRGIASTRHVYCLFLPRGS